MRLSKISTRSFRGLGDRTIELSGSFHVIEGGNEAGKSSLTKAVFAGLFTDAGSVKFGEHCYWGTDGCAVALEGDIDGVPFVIERDTAGKKNRFAVGDHECTTKSQVQARISSLLGMPSEASYRNSAWIDQSEVRRIKDDKGELRQIMEERITGSEGIHLSTVFRKLNADATTLVGSPKGSADRPLKGELRLALDELGRLQAELQAAHRDADALQQMLAHLPADRAELQEVESGTGDITEHLQRDAEHDEAVRACATATKILTDAVREDELRARYERQAAAAEKDIEDVQPDLQLLSDRIVQQDRLLRQHQELQSRIETLKAGLTDSQSEVEQIKLLRERLAILEPEVAAMEAAVSEARCRLHEARQSVAAQSELGAQLRDMRSEHTRIERTLHHIEESLARGNAYHDELSRLPNIEPEDVANAARLRDEIRTLEEAISGLGITVTLDPQSPGTWTAVCDGDPTPGQVLSARQSIALDIGCFGRVMVENTSENSQFVDELRRKQTVLRQLLASCDVASPAEVAALYNRRSALQAKIAEEAAIRRASLGDRTCESLRDRCCRLDAEIIRVEGLAESVGEPAAVTTLEAACRDAEARHAKGEREAAVIEGGLSQKRTLEELAIIIARSAETIDRLEATLTDIISGLLSDEDRMRLSAEQRSAQGRLDTARQQKAAALEMLSNSRSSDELAALRDSAADEIAVQRALAKRSSKYAISQEDRLAKERDLNRLKGRRQELRDSIRDAERDVALARYDSGDVQSLQERISSGEARVGRLRRRAKAIDLCRTLITEARDRTIADITPGLESNASRYLGVLTKGRYTEVRLGTDLQLAVCSPEKARLEPEGEGWIELGKPATSLRDLETSGGVIDQAHLAVRLALVKSLCRDARPPVILDDPFVNCDLDRVSAAFDLLRELSSEYQVIVLTCHQYPQVRPAERIRI